MSALQEIEAALQKLPRRELELLYRQLSKRLAPGPSCYDLTRELLEEPGRIGARGKRVRRIRHVFTGFGSQG